MACNSIPTSISYTNQTLPYPLPGLLPIDNYAYYNNLCYGNLPKQTFDIIIPKRPDSKKVPLVIFIHGGGFFGGDKSLGFKKTAAIEQLLHNYVAFASINYRLLKKAPKTETEGIKKCLFDIRRCLQVLRLNADVFNLDKHRVALWGVSAGSGAALWLAFNPNMADNSFPQTDFRSQSTRVKAVYGQQTQATYKLERWANDIFNNVTLNNGTTIPITLECIAKIIGENEVKSYYLIPTNAPYTAGDITDAYTNYTAANDINLDILDLMTLGDPPIWLESGKIKVKFPNNCCPPPFSPPLSLKNQLQHHPFHAKTLLSQAQSMNDNVPPEFHYVVRIPKLGISGQHGLPDYSSKTAIDFLIDRLA